MSKRCELQKEYYQQYGNYKGNGKYSDEYVSWLESEVLSLRQTLDTGMCIDCDWIDIDYYQKKYKNYVAL